MTDLYDKDFFAWTQAQADALKRRSANEIDWDNLLEEVETLGRSERAELTSRLTKLLSHLLKWRYQVSFRSKSWALTIVEQRRQVAKHLAENPSLKHTLEETLDDAFESAVVEAVKETGLGPEVLTTERRPSYEAALKGEVEALDDHLSSTRKVKP